MIGVAYNTQAIKTDVNGKPIPQYYDALHDEYRPLQGENGASRAILYGPDGNPISTTHPLGVRAADLEALVGALADSAVTDPAANASVIAALKGILADLGQTTDAMVDAGAAGSVAAKLRRVTNDLSGVLAKLDVAASTRASETTLADVKAAVEALAALIENGALKTALQGSLRGPASARPAANTVENGTIYWSTDTGEVSVSTGSTWRSLGVA